MEAQPRLAGRPRGSGCPCLLIQPSTSRPAPPHPYDSHPRPAAILAAPRSQDVTGTPASSRSLSDETKGKQSSSIEGSAPPTTPHPAASQRRRLAATQVRPTRPVARKAAYGDQRATVAAAPSQQSTRPVQPAQYSRHGLSRWGLPLQSLVLLPPLQRPTLPQALLPLIRHGGRRPCGRG